MSPSHADPERRGLAHRMARTLGRSLTYLREAFIDEDDASFRAWAREQRQRTREGRRS